MLRGMIGRGSGQSFCQSERGAVMTSVMHSCEANQPVYTRLKARNLLIGGDWYQPIRKGRIGEESGLDPVEE
jgi:hypothetical protein